MAEHVDQQPGYCGYSHSGYAVPPPHPAYGHAAQPPYPSYGHAAQPPYGQAVTPTYSSYAHTVQSPYPPYGYTAQPSNPPYVPAEPAAQPPYGQAAWPYGHAAPQMQPQQKPNSIFARLGMGAAVGLISGAAQVGISALFSG